MKTKIILISIALISAYLLIPVSLRAQKNLEFSRVLLVESATQTVPADKVWKVESALSSSGTAVYSYMWIAGSVNNFTYPVIYSGIVVNGTTIYLDAGAGVLGNKQTACKFIISSDHSTPTRLPLWLPENATLAAGNNVKYVSVIEYNVVP